MTAKATAMAIKRRAEGALEEVFRALFEEIDTAKIRAEVEQLKATSPSYRPAHHAHALARRTAIRCAAAGAVTSIPAGPLAIGVLSADLAYLIYQQFRLIVGIATVYGHESSGRERFKEALACLASASGTRLVRDRLAKIIPVVGVVSGSALNYISVHAVARAAIRYYEQRSVHPSASSVLSTESSDVTGRRNVIPGTPVSSPD